jgi:hypothetical protein
MADSPKIKYNNAAEAEIGKRGDLFKRDRTMVESSTKRKRTCKSVGETHD